MRAESTTGSSIQKGRQKLAYLGPNNTDDEHDEFEVEVEVGHK